MTPQVNSVVAVPEALAEGSGEPQAKKEGLRKPQLRILAYLAKSNAGASRKEISENAPCDSAWLTEWLGSFDPATREKNDGKPGGFPSLLTLGYVEMEGGRGNAVYRITAVGRKALEAGNANSESPGGLGHCSDPSEAAAAIEDPNAFVLENYLEEFIVSNFDAIFKGALKIYVDADGNDGQQYATDIGPIDILAVETKSDSFVVIELKKGRPSDQVVGRTLRYMGWVKKTLCSAGQAVRGLIVCRDPGPKLSYALEMTSNIDVRYYSVSFKLGETP